ncbi:LYR motif-containing protein 1-like isoform X2 [Physella acuta]|uniref:LYR motif-containing protein 1-like isoform X2 n=1 Tax=Physella acuta TaxID=109671 RepID=UPI0027DE9F7E|nr:LYR motif-containing protein 1-like isoform X2 [Physella acuta]
MFHLMANSTRRTVLSLYKQILRLSKSWTSISGLQEDTLAERSYIRKEAQQLFKQNKWEKSEVAVREFIREAETRIGLAEHYGIPYPRMVNSPQNMLPPHVAKKYKKDNTFLSQATPIYLKSYDKSKTDR